MSKDTKKSLGIVLPALNEEKSLEIVVLNLLRTEDKTDWNFEIIIVDDGSDDSTLKIAEDLAMKHSNIKVLSNISSMNIGHCYKMGVNSLESDYVTWLPTDGEIDSELILIMLKEVSEDKIVIPYPKGGKKIRTPLRRFLSIMYQGLINTRYETRIKYFNGNSIVSRKFFMKNSFISEGFTINAEIIISALKSEKLIPVEIPFTLKKRIGDREKALRVKNVLNVIFSLVKIFRRYNA